VKILKEEGPLAFFKGLEATLWRHGMWNGGYFGVIHGVKNALPDAESAEGKLFKNFVAGSIGGTCGTILNTPFDVVKTRIQNQIVPHGTLPKYGWTLPSLALITKEEGYLSYNIFSIYMHF
jgi:solute carrier family 25 2-oxodicarboxylate transporter 21